MNVLFVCTGNINRSAAAEVMSRVHRPEWNVRSAATNLKANKPMSKKMRDLLTYIGYPGPEFHRSTALTKELVDWADLVIGFQPSHLKAVEDLGGCPRSLVEFLSPDREPMTKIPDPAFDSTGNTHQQVIVLLAEALDRIEK